MTNLNEREDRLKKFRRDARTELLCCLARGMNYRTACNLILSEKGDLPIPEDFLDWLTFGQMSACDVKR